MIIKIKLNKYVNYNVNKNEYRDENKMQKKRLHANE